MILLDVLIYWATPLYTELFYSDVREAIEAVEDPKNSTLFVDHILCQIYISELNIYKEMALHLVMQRSTIIHNSRHFFC